jgi:YVTN family beta-propeller protein
MGGSRIAHVPVAAAIALLQLATEVGAAVHAYIPDGSGNVVSRMDLATNEAVPITVGEAPLGVGASADGSTVVVSNSADATVSVIDGVAGTVRWTVPVGSFPRGVGVTPDGGKAFVVNTGDQTISVVDTVAGVVTKTISVAGQMDAVAMSPSGHRAYVSNASFAGTLLVLDTVGDIVLTESLVSTTSAAHGVIASLDGTRVYVGLDSALAIVDATTNLFLDEVPFPGDCCIPAIDLTISPDGSRVYAGQLGGSGALAIATATHDVTQLPSSSAFSATTGVDLSPDGATLYVLNSGAGTIDLIDTATDTIRATLGALVDFPAAIGEFIAGPTPPVTPPPPPLLDAAARTCQKALLDSFKPFAAKAHQLLSGCLQRIQKDRAAGIVTSGTTTACTRDLDPANAASRLQRARALAKQRVIARCATSSPAALGAPCVPTAPTISELAECALDRQLAGVSRIVADEVATPCGLLALVGLGTAFPEMCP